MYLELTHYQKRLLTTEDPVEGKIKGAVQRSIVADKSDPEAVARAWVAAITSALRLDPDALLIGELRDSDSARAGIIAALTGHIVTGTTHTPDAIRILDRLIETFGVNPSLVADPQLLIGLISQRLVARLCPDCKQPYAAIQARLHEDDRALLAEHATPETLYFRHPEGCDHCYKGVIGRIAIVEVIRPDALFMEKYLTQGKLKTRSHWVHRMGGITRRRHLQGYLATSEVDPLEAHLICPLDEDERLLLPEEALND